MASRFIASTILLSFLLLSSMVSMVNGVCNEPMGGCENCDKKCKAKHHAGVGICDYFSVCKCIYPCQQPQQLTKTTTAKAKTDDHVCKGTVAILQTGCYDDYCNQLCAQKYPGLEQGHGSCVPVGPYVTCYCLYNC